MKLSNMKTIKSRVLSMGLVAMFGVFAFSGCGFMGKTEENRTAPIAQEVDESYFSSASVSRGDVTSYASYRLNYKASDGASLKFSVDNVKISKRYVEVGDYVKKGDLLVECSSSDLNHKYARLEAEIAEYQAKVDYYTSMVELETERKLVYASYGQVYDSLTLDSYLLELETANKNLNIARLDLDETNAQLEQCRIYASMDGVVSYIANTSDRHKLKKSDTAIKLTDEQPFFQCITDQTEYFEVGKTFTLEYYYPSKNKNSGGVRNHYGFAALDDGTEEEVDDTVYSITVECISMEPVNDSETIKSLRFTTNDDFELEPGVSAVFEINIVKESSKNVLFVPNGSVISSGDESVVYIQEDDGARSIKKVVTGVVGDEITEIKEGLELGETVLMKVNK